MTASAKAASILTVLSLALLVAAVPASAGVLSIDTSLSYNGVFGSTSFVDASGDLSGNIEWIVLGPGNFDDAYPDALYSPPDDHLTYVYQIFNTGTDAISSFSLPVINPADNIGNFVSVGIVSGGAPTSQLLTVPGAAFWDFSGNNVGTSASSSGLVFSSPNIPQEIFFTVVNGGNQAMNIPVPTPDDVPIPEPSTVVLMMLGAMLSLAPGARRRRRKD